MDGLVVRSFTHPCLSDLGQDVNSKLSTTYHIMSDFSSLTWFNWTQLGFRDRCDWRTGRPAASLHGLFIRVVRLHSSNFTPRTLSQVNTVHLGCSEICQSSKVLTKQPNDKLLKENANSGFPISKSTAIFLRTYNVAKSTLSSSAAVCWFCLINLLRDLRCDFSILAFEVIPTVNVLMV